MTHTARLLGLAFLMTLVLTGMVGMHANQRASGMEVRLSMEPVDPRDILLGHYITLRTPLHRLNLDEFDETSDEDWQRGDSIFVQIAPDEDGIWMPVAIFRSNAVPALNESGAVLIQGYVDYVSERLVPRTRPDTDPENEVSTDIQPVPVEQNAELQSQTELRVRYNLERYYAAQDRALELESMRNEDRLILIVAVGSTGKAVIKGLSIDGEDHYDRLF